MKKVSIPYEMRDGMLNMPSVVWPQRCPCCGSEQIGQLYFLQHRARYSSTTTGAQTVSRYYPLKWQVPYCEQCTRHAKWEQSKWVIAAIGIVFMLVVLFTMGNNDLLGLLSMAGYIVVGVILYQILLRIMVFPKMTSRCAHSGYAVSAADDDQRIFFIFHNNEQAELFAQMNHATLQDHTPTNFWSLRRKDESREAARPIPDDLLVSQAEIGQKKSIKKVATTLEKSQKIGAWIGALLIGILFLAVSLLYPLEGVPGYMWVTSRDFSIVMGFAFSFIVGALLGAILGGLIGSRVGKNRQLRKQTVRDSARQPATVSLGFLEKPTFQWSKNGFVGSNQAWINQLQHENDSAITWFNAQNFIPIPTHLGEAAAAEYCFRMSFQAQNNGNDQEAWAGYHQALRRFCILNDEKMIGVTSFNLGKVYGVRKNWEMARLMFAQSVYLANRIGDSKGYAWSLVYLGDVSDKLSDKPLAVELMSKALPVLQELSPGDVPGVQAALQRLQKGD